jgi:glycosyltransferase involved in cell wall biosynthesis
MVTLKHIPSVPCHNEVKKDPTFDEDVSRLTEALDPILAETDIVLSHDIVYQPAALKHNFAARKVAEKYPNIKWLHWIHSATAPYTLSMLLGVFTDEYINLVKTAFPNSFYVFFNDYSKPRIANNFNVDESLVKTVHHPIDVAGFLDLDPNVAKLMKEKSLLSADAIAVYPCRLDRGKQVEYVIKTMAMLKEFNMSIRVIVVDFHSTGGDKVTYRDQLKNLAIDFGLNAQEITFTSEYCEAWHVSAPHKVVRDLMLLSNVFIMPSVSESYSLVTQEAAFLGKVIVLNFDFPPFRDIFGPNAIFRKYSSNIDIMNGMDGNTTTAYGPDKASEQERLSYERNYHRETAGMIAYRLRNYDNLAMQTRIRQTRNLDAVFKKELEPLMFSI